MSSSIKYDDIRAALLAEAQGAPNLLTDLAGLERYVAESYNSRSFIELLQNADDARSSKFVVVHTQDIVLVANNGRPFSPEDFHSLCRSAASTKTRGETIGYRGIGFKSVVGLASTVYLFSNQLEVAFSRERTREVIPEAEQVPLIRVPHLLTAADQKVVGPHVTALRNEGFTTIFGFRDLVAAGIESEFTNFDATSLLFLRHVAHVELRTTTIDRILLTRDVAGESWEHLTIERKAQKSHWFVHKIDDIGVAIAVEDRQAVRMPTRDAVVHAFLPTHEPTGLGIKVNGDFSTDPSRTRLVFDERTARSVQRLASTLANMLTQALQGTDLPVTSGLIEVLSSQEDPRVMELQRRSFAMELLKAVRENFQSSAPTYRLRPQWLNATDYKILASAAGIGNSQVPGIDELFVRTSLRYFGLSEATFEDLVPSLAASEVTPTGAAEIASELIKLSLFSRTYDDIAPTWRIWQLADGTVASLSRVIELSAPLNRSFLDSVTEKIGSPNDLERFLARHAPAGIIQKLLTQVDSQDITGDSMARTVHFAAPQNVPAAAPIAKPASSIITTRLAAPGSAPKSHSSINATRWRSAETQVQALLEQLGWTVSDVSRQNLGYDLKATADGGEEVHVEVKSVRYFGEAFTLTSNEEAVARTERQKYWIALVCETATEIQLGIIKNPAATLELERQCRQWVWECSSYEVQVDSFPVA